MSWEKPGIIWPTGFDRRRRTLEYDAASRVVSDTLQERAQVGSTVTPRTSTTAYDYRLKVGSAWTGADLGGVVTRQSTTASGGGDPTVSSTLETAHVWRDGATRTGAVHSTSDPDADDWTASYASDALGRLTSATIADGRPRTVGFAYNAEGQVIHRFEDHAGTGADLTQRSLFVAGRREMTEARLRRRFEVWQNTPFSALSFRPRHTPFAPFTRQFTSACSGSPGLAAGARRSNF